MKKSTFLIIVFFFVFTQMYAQQGISFQGIARDPAGNALNNDNIEVKFTIGSFTETHTLSTDQFGIFSATIGSVNTAAFNDLVFANIDENLKVEVTRSGITNTIYDQKFNSVPYAKSAENGVPPGCIMPFAGNAANVPDGWVLCDGRSLATTGIYSKLFLAIGNAWGGSGSNFNIPDLRGIFLRGVNEGRTDSLKDPDNRNVGNLQSDAFKSHNHPITDPGHYHVSQYRESETDAAVSDNKEFDPVDYVADNDIHTVNDDTNPATTSITVNNTGGAETRPKNAAVNYIIKY